MRRNDLLRLMLLVLVPCAFGAVDAIVKGHEGGTRNVIGNVSAPWALVPFLSAAFLMPRRRTIGALTGVVSTGIALAKYSFVRAVGRLTWGTTREMPSLCWLRRYRSVGFSWGAPGGAALGVVGSWLAVRREQGAVAVVVASLLVFEPGARIVWAIAEGEAAHTLVPSPAICMVEV